MALASQLYSRLKYVAWAALRVATDHDRTCPYCKGGDSALVHRKYGVTTLRECRACGLRFRVPKERPERSAQFYQEEYQQGSTTDCPSDLELERLLVTRFQGTAEDFTRYLALLSAAGVHPPARIFDFGCSWGYGSWQLREAGYRVYSYEIGAPRARYARDRLGCTMVSDPLSLPEQVDCFFSAHVIEHLPDPNAFWEVAAGCVAESGAVVCVTPNGDPRAETRLGPKIYHQLWGQVHPLLLTARAFAIQATNAGFDRFRVVTSPLTGDGLEDRVRGDTADPLTGDEIALIASRRLPT
jgi:2-polyprenyl-3-methyl-5-hydroxy-6-metoxy-1,4-benzoquinol methylase